MDLIDRYIRSVRLFLPKEQRDDIIRELEEDIRSQVEDKQAELDRPLNNDEQAAMLRLYGHPMLMAARYRRARNLIGPVIFPIYWQVLKLVLALFTASHLASIGLLASRGGSWSEIGAAVSRLLDNGLEAAVLITLVAACLEWSLTRFKVLEQWDPSSLPLHGLRIAERTAARAVFKGMKGVGDLDVSVRRALEESGPPLQVRSIPEFVMLAVVSCWSVLGLLFPSLIFASGSSMLDWSPAVDRMFPFIVIAVALALVDQFVRLIRPGASFLRFTRVLWANAGWVLILLLLIGDYTWVVWIGTPEQWARFGTFAEFSGRTWSLVDVVNGIITATLAVVAVASLIGPLWRLRRMFGSRGPYAAQV
jgi:hypothetical protein